MKYRKKPLIIEAICFTGKNIKDVREFVGHKIYSESYDMGHCDRIAVKTTPGKTEDASVGDFIIKGTDGLFSTCKPDVFKNLYEAVE